VERARIAKFDERLSLLGMLLDKLENEMRENLEKSDYLTELMRVLKLIKTLNDRLNDDGDRKTVGELVEAQIENRHKIIEAMTTAGTLSDVDKKKNRAIIRFLEQRLKEIRLENLDDSAKAFGLLKAAFDSEVSNMKEENATIQARLHNLFAFSEVAFMDGNEVLVLVTELTINTYSTRFIAAYGSEDYKKHNEDLMLHERQDDIMNEIKALEL
jgi:hypothetical protein